MRLLSAADQRFAPTRCLEDAGQLSDVVPYLRR
jgi:hypothetical protein